MPQPMIATVPRAVAPTWAAGVDAAGEAGHHHDVPGGKVHRQFAREAQAAAEALRAPTMATRAPRAERRIALHDQRGRLPSASVRSGG